MIIPDVNLLLYATIAAFPQHDRARAWWESAVNGDAQIGLASPAVFGFLRVATNSRVLTPAMGMDVAGDHVRQWLGRPNVRLVVPGPDHVEIALRLLDATGTAANLTTAAQLASLAIEQNAQVYSNDTDFGRFAGLNWVDPLATS